MTKELKQSTDDLLKQAVCLVFVGDSQATGWLFSDDGHLLTVGHVFDGVASSDTLVDVKFLGEGQLKARRLYRFYNKDTADDFAILKIENADAIAGRKPLPVAFVRSVDGNWKLQGYGRTLAGLSAGRGKFIGLANLQSEDDFFFKLDSKQTGEPGFSGSPIFSEQLRAVVAIQTEATTTPFGAERDTVLAVPLWRIKNRWTKLPSLAYDVDSGRADQGRYDSPKTYLEYRIKKAYRRLHLAKTKATSPSPTDLLESKYSHAIELYLRVYFLLCRRLGRPADPGILDIAQHFPEVEPQSESETLGRAKTSTIYTNLPGSRITVGVSQMFRIADLLTRPASVKAREFYEAITNANKLRRALSDRRAFKLGALGSLRPVVRQPKNAAIKAKDYDPFWNPGIPNLRLPTAQPLCFIPYELSLARQLQQFRLGSDEDTLLNSITTSESIQNSQINGRLRIYPPGIGVISLRLNLEFKDGTPIELVAQIAHNVEQLLFVGPNDQKPYDVLMLKIIDRVIDNLFLDEGFSYENRRWTPPVTTFSFPEGQGLMPAERIAELSYLVSLAPANDEDLEKLDARIRRALRTSRWTHDRILAVAGRGVGLFYVDDQDNKMLKQRRQNFRIWLTETHELISAAAYAQKAFAEEIHKLFSERVLDDSWLPPGDRFTYLQSLLETMRQVMRAIVSIGAPDGHLKNQGAGALLTFARDIWKYSNPVDLVALDQGLLYVAHWLASDSTNAPAEIVQLRTVVDAISKMTDPFAVEADRQQAVDAGAAEPDLGTDIMDMLTELEEMLQESEPEEFAETGRQQVLQQLRKQLA